MRKPRQHVNPLSSYYQRRRAKAIQTDELDFDCRRIEVELGCADGDFSFSLAALEPQTLVVGLEIREEMVARNERRNDREGHKNLRFAYVNMNVDLDAVFRPASVDRFHLLFPDPWFKGRHQKRRVVDSALLDVLFWQLKEGGELHVATDVFDLGLAAMSELEEYAEETGRLRNQAGTWSFSRQSPTAAKSRREEMTLRKGQRVWRMRYDVVKDPEKNS